MTRCACCGKVCFRTKADALASAARMMRGRKRDHKRCAFMRAYRCERAAVWHLTHQRRKEDAR